MADKKLYRKYPNEVIESQERFDHVFAMTDEELHLKSEIANELAYRDIKIKELEEKLEYVKGYVDAARSDDSTAHDTDAVDWIIELLGKV